MTGWLITGGTGTLGHALMNHYAVNNFTVPVTIFSRDELKQKQMQKLYPWARYVIGDIRDASAVERVVKGHELVFHFAALKHVDTGEENPDEAAKTNFEGTRNIAHACEKTGVKKLIFSSTDKAVEPWNAYGAAKLLAEKLLVGNFWPMSYIFRWGNVLGSRGSVIPFFIDQIKNDKPIPVTDMEMTRFWIPIEDAVAFILRKIKEENTDKVYIPCMKSFPLMGIIDLLGEILDKHPQIKEVGLRPGEKVHESLYSSPNYSIHSNTSEQYTLGEMTELLRRFV